MGAAEAEQARPCDTALADPVSTQRRGSRGDRLIGASSNRSPRTGTACLRGPAPLGRLMRRKPAASGSPADCMSGPAVHCGADASSSRTALSLREPTRAVKRSRSPVLTESAGLRAETGLTSAERWMVGDTGLEPVTSCMSSVPAGALCYERGGPSDNTSVMRSRFPQAGACEPLGRESGLGRHASRQRAAGFRDLVPAVHPDGLRARGGLLPGASTPTLTDRTWRTTARQRSSCRSSGASGIYPWS